MPDAQRTIDIAAEFSRYPAGRYAQKGPFSGESFRDDYLVPALAELGSVRIEFDGTAGFGSSFLEEAFGGLVRKRIATANELHQRFDLISEDSSLISEIWEYIDQVVAATSH